MVAFRYSSVSAEFSPRWRWLAAARLRVLSYFSSSLLHAADAEALAFSFSPRQPFRPDSRQAFTLPLNRNIIAIFRLRLFISIGFSFR